MMIILALSRYILVRIYKKKRMTTLIKTKFNKLDDQTNADKYIVAATITKNLIKINLPFNHYS